MKKMLKLIFISLGMLLIFSACSSQSNTSQSSKSSTEKISSTSNMEEMNHNGMIPTNMKDAVNSKFPVGSNVILLSDHMEGMKGAKAKVVGAYSTTIYEVSYQPTTGGEVVKNHKWVVQEELKNSSTTAKKGDPVILNADHMKGMNGADAHIERAIEGTVYVVDYTPTNGDKEVKNHMWVTEDELKENNN